MHLSAADMKASREGFKFLVLSPTGARKCYCTTASEAKAEAGKGGKIVVLARGRYTSQNPSARMVGLQRNPAKSNPASTGGRLVDVRTGALVEAQAPAHLVAVLRKMGGKLPVVQYRDGGVRVTMIDDGNVEGGYSYRGVVKLQRNPAKRRRNPTWFTTGVLAAGAYVYGRSAKVREKIKGAIDSAHKKLENPGTRQQFYLTDGRALVPVGKYAKRESARKKANNMVARDLELRGMRLVSAAEMGS